MVDCARMGISRKDMVVCQSSNFISTHMTAVACDRKSFTALSRQTNTTAVQNCFCLPLQLVQDSDIAPNVIIQ